MIHRKVHFTINDLQRLTDDYAGYVCDYVVPYETVLSRPQLVLGSETGKSGLLKIIVQSRLLTIIVRLV